MVLSLSFYRYIRELPPVSSPILLRFLLAKPGQHPVHRLARQKYGGMQGERSQKRRL